MLYASHGHQTPNALVTAPCSSKPVTMPDLDHFTRVDFSRFKTFEKFTLPLRHFNILVGPNNAGKSTILAAFRILAAAMRRANTRGSELVNGPQGHTSGASIDLSTIAVAEE